MCEPVSLSAAMPYMLGMAGAGLAMQYQNGEDAKKAQSEANQTAKAAAVKNADMADQAFNKANGKQPDIASMMGQNALNAKGGQSGTMLTGAGGIDPSTLLLGKKTLLGA